MKCSFCGKAEAVAHKPKIYDFNFNHAMKRYAVPEIRENINYWNVTYYFKTVEDQNKWIAAHPEWMITDWYNICADCLPHVRSYPESSLHLLDFIERRIGAEAMDLAIEAAVREKFSLLLGGLRHGNR